MPTKTSISPSDQAGILASVEGFIYFCSAKCLRRRNRCSLQLRRREIQAEWEPSGPGESAFACTQLSGLCRWRKGSDVEARSLRRPKKTPLPSLHTASVSKLETKRGCSGASGISLLGTQASLRTCDVIFNNHSSSRRLFSFKAPRLPALVEALGWGLWPAARAPRAMHARRCSPRELGY